MLYDRDTFEHKGRQFRVTFPNDEGLDSAFAASVQADRPDMQLAE